MKKKPTEFAEGSKIGFKTEESWRTLKNRVAIYLEGDICQNIGLGVDLGTRLGA